MPSFVQDIWVAYGIARDSLLLAWARLSIPTKMLIVLAVTAGMIYAGSKAEKTGWSAVIFLGSFGLFAYILVLGYSVMH
jgi:hypothetical protein